MKEVYIIGVGLIGGSFARDIRTALPEVHVVGIDASDTHLAEALSLGLIDTVGAMENLASADMVVLATPVDTVVTLLPEVLNHIGEHTVVIDMGSTKEGICAAVRTHPRRRHYLACHPIAGTEFSGPSAAIEGLYNGKTNIVCEVEKTAFRLQERALELFKKMGMRIRYMDPASHDKHIAYVSHLSHISAFMLGKTVIDKEKNERDIFDMAGSGFASTVRLAKSNPVTWTSIFKENKENVLETLEDYISNLTAFKNLLETENYQGVHDEMENTNHIKEILNGIE